MLHPRTRGSRAGFTFIELAVVLVILLVALLIFSSTVTGMAKQRTVNRETSLAVAAAKNQLETLRSQDFAQLWVLYNRDPLDDPGGANTAPGAFFAVPGLSAVAGAPGGMAGEVVLPSFEDPVAGWQLREDQEIRALGLPRDLSGDNKVDDQDHGGGYFILPVQIRIRWVGPNGLREYAMSSQLCRFVKA